MTWLDNLKELRARLAAAEETHNFDLISQVVVDYETALHDNADRLIECAERRHGKLLGFGSVVDAGGDLGKSVVVEVEGSYGKVYSAAKGGPYGVDLDMMRPWVGP